MAGESPDQRRWLREQLEAWVREDLISAHQAAAISSRYPAEPFAVRSQTQRRIAIVFGTLGALLVGLGIILFFSANWQGISPWTKFSLILTATGGTYALGYWLQFRKGYLGIGSAVLLLGGLLYGAGIFLVGQTFNVRAEPHYGLLLWTAGLLPLAYALPSVPLVTLAAVVFAAWVVFVGFLGPDRYGVSDIHYPFANSIAAAAILYGVARLHERTALARLGRSHLVTGGLLAFSMLLAYINVLPERLGSEVALPRDLVILRWGLTTAAVGTLAAGVLFAPHRARSAGEAGVFALLVLAAWIGTSATLWVVGLTLLYFAVCLGAVVLGVSQNDRALVNLGLVFFSIGIAVEYVKIVGQYLTSSAFFIGGGILLLAGGWLVERTRRRLLARMGSRADES